MDDHVVERQEHAIADPCLEEGAALQREVTCRPSVQGLALFAELHLGQEPETAGIDPKDWNPRRGCLLGGPEQRPVAADTDDQAGAVELADQRPRPLLRGCAVRPHPKAARLEASPHLHHGWAADLDAGVAYDPAGVRYGLATTVALRHSPW